MAKKEAEFKYPGPWLVKKALLKRAGVADDQLVVFDVGAYKGNTVAMYRRMWPAAHIFAFEPIPESVEGLRQRFAGDPLVRVIDKALAQRAGTRRMYMGGQGLEMSSLLQRPRTGRRYFRHELEDQMLVEATTVDAFCEESDLSHINMMKVDVQGGESRVFEGAKRMLEEQRIGLIYVEVMFVPMYERQKLFWEICRMLDAHGMTLHSFYGFGVSKVTFQVKYADALFVSAAIRKGVVDALPEEWLAKNHRALIDGV